MAIQIQALMEFLLIGGACLAMSVLAYRTLIMAMAWSPPERRRFDEPVMWPPAVVTSYIVGGVSAAVALILLIVCLASMPYNAAAMVDPVGRLAMDKTQAEAKAAQCGKGK